MKTLKYICLALVSTLVLAGCIGKPEFVNHPAPDLTAPDFAPFAQAGCPADEYGRMLCAPDSPLAALGCDRIEPLADLQGGLSPALPMAYCFFETSLHWDNPDLNFQAEADGYVYATGGLSPVYVRYVTVRDGQFQVLKTRADFQAVFAPLESAEEALGYALAVTDYSAYYGLAYERGMRYLSKHIEDTHVSEVDGGYQVHLYKYRFFGCGPHTTSAIDLLVTSDGGVQEIEVEGIYENPDEDNLCVD